MCCYMLPCSVHSSSARHWAVGNLWRGRNSFFLHQEICGSLSAVLNVLHHHAERGNKQRPNALAPTWRAKCRRGNSPAGWRSAPALNPKMRKGLKRFACPAKRTSST